MKWYGWYKLDEDHEPHRVVADDEYYKWFEDDNNRRVARTEFPDGTVVSTVFLGLDLSFGDGEPLLFETMVFGGDHDGKMTRSSTWDQAWADHHLMCSGIKPRRLGWIRKLWRSLNLSIHFLLSSRGSG